MICASIIMVVNKKTCFTFQQISRAQAAAAAAAAKAAFVAVQQQHLTNGGIVPTYNPDIPLFREANSLLAAAGAANNLDSAAAVMAGNDNTSNENHTNTNLLSVTNLATSTPDGNLPTMAMNLTTHAKNSPNNSFVTSDQSESLGQSQTKDSIDLTLPITSTYIKRMKALGLTTGYEHLYGQHAATGFNVSSFIHQFLAQIKS